MRKRKAASAQPVPQRTYEHINVQQETLCHSRGSGRRQNMESGGERKWQISEILKTGDLRQGSYI